MFVEIRTAGSENDFHLRKASPSDILVWPFCQARAHNRMKGAKFRILFLLETTTRGLLLRFS